MRRAGAYRNENGDVKFGYNLGASIAIFIHERLELVPRYDFRSVNGVEPKYSTLQLGLRFGF